MFRAFALSVVIVVLAGLPRLEADEPAAKKPADTEPPRLGLEKGLVNVVPANMFRSVQIVRDLAEYNILNLRPRETEAWIVAEIVPGGLSGALHNQGAYIQAETGKVIDSGIRPRLVTLVGGQWKRLELLSGEAPAEGRFEWKEPYVDNSFDRHFNIYDQFSVFTGPKNNGTVICQFFKDRAGAAKFSSVTSIPDDWKTFVKPAYAYHVRHSAEFADSDLNGLRKMASGDNPFIALTAIRHLLGKTTTEEEFDQLADLARSLPKFRQAVLTYLLLKKNDDPSLDAILKAISRSKTAAELPGLALGMESWAASRGRGTLFMDPGATKNLREKVIEKWQGFDPSTDDVEDWKSWRKILVTPGVQEGKSIQVKK